VTAAVMRYDCRPGELRTLQWREVRAAEFVILAGKAKDGPDGNELAPDAHVFGNEVGDEMGRRALCKPWLATSKRAKVENPHLHDLRGEAGSQLLEAGTNSRRARRAWSLEHDDDQHLPANARQQPAGRASSSACAAGCATEGSCYRIDVGKAHLR
jgi:integrase